MKQNNILIHKISALMMLMLLLLPIVSEAMHALGEHDHPTCEEVTTHLHELESECAICDFHFTAFTFTPLQQIVDTLVKKDTQRISSYASIVKINISFTYLLRGPPTIQHDC